jgi:hypothetical protein
MLSWVGMQIHKPTVADGAGENTLFSLLCTQPNPNDTYTTTYLCNFHYSVKWSSYARRCRR